MNFRFDRTSRTATLTSRGGLGLLAILAILALPLLLSMGYSLPEDEAARLVRQHLKYQAGQDYAALYRRGAVDARASERYQETMRKIDELRFESIKTGRLLPDYFLSLRPSYYAKVVIRDDTGLAQTRYFNLGKGYLVLGESSRTAWFFVL